MTAGTITQSQQLIAASLLHVFHTTMGMVNYHDQGLFIAVRRVAAAWPNKKHLTTRLRTSARGLTTGATARPPRQKLIVPPDQPDQQPAIDDGLCRSPAARDSASISFANSSGKRTHHGKTPGHAHRQLERLVRPTARPPPLGTRTRRRPSGSLVCAATEQASPSLCTRPHRNTARRIGGRRQPARFGSFSISCPSGSPRQRSAAQQCPGKK
jgi:hypothetical protein